MNLQTSVYFNTYTIPYATATCCAFRRHSPAASRSSVVALVDVCVGATAADVIVVAVAAAGGRADSTTGNITLTILVLKTTSLIVHLLIPHNPHACQLYVPITTSITHSQLVLC